MNGRQRTLETLTLVAVLALAALLRLGWPGVSSFGYDEARVSLLALQMARLGQLPRVGIQSSAGLPNMPGAIWIFALPYLLSSDPLVATLCVGIMGVLAVWGVWVLARQAWGQWAAFVAALLFATSPYAVRYSRSIWSQNLLPPIAVLWACAAMWGSAKPRRVWALLLHGFLAGSAFQIHYAGLALIPATLWWVARARLWRQWPALAAGATLACVAASPFVREVWRSPVVRAGFLGALREPARLDLQSLLLWARMSVGSGWEGTVLGAGWRWGYWPALASSVSQVLLGVLTLGGLIQLVAPKCGPRSEQARPASEPLWLLLPAWAVAAPLVFARHSVPIYPQYLLVALPAFSLVAGTVVAWRRERWWHAVVASLAVLVAAAQALMVARSLTIVHTTPTPGGMGTPLAYPRAAARALQDGSPVAVHAYGDQPEFYGDVAGFEVLLWDYPHAVVDGRSVLLVPATPSRADGKTVVTSHLLVTFEDLPVLQEAQAAALGDTVRYLPRRVGEPPFVALELAGNDPASGGLQPTTAFQRVTPVTLANGAQLLGWRARMVAGKLRVSTWWTIVGRPTGERYHQFNHLRTTLDGPPSAVRDASVSSGAWRQGDTVIGFVDFERPGNSGPCWVEVGMYSYPQLQRVAVVGRDGDPLAPIRLGPFDVPAP